MIGNRIKTLRIEKDLLQKDLANKLRLSQQTISLYESGKREPDYETLNKIAKFFNVSVDFILGNSDIRNPYKDNKEELPDSFETPEEAIKFLLEQNVIMGFGGFDVNKLSDEEKVEFANELLNQLKLLSYKYKK
ncbi:helix-turn-helix transcriptional regulator [Tissierella sp. MB52-C2]|uniref:helix-turn-helix domain-containing protein n=1 Tax=Tissierella sp. MB52-C2 TaxID=3070999 RepID=UPI00280B5590|nr:helix-turn-helix transcriptional regulator [Tissierella sp. MB52-C2]WMM26704.1 helix-turn-helix transcriptional regulator [Tissierella sp. MB52-C2]